MSNAEKKLSGDVKEIATIKLTDEQRALVERTTGVALSEIWCLSMLGLAHAS
jgi:hypothetical protein